MNQHIRYHQISIEYQYMSNILIFNWYLMIPYMLVHILDCASRTILIFSSSDPLLVLFEALECVWHFECFFGLQLPLQMLDHIFFDNNCSLAKHVKNNSVFKNVGLSVDIFHFSCKHSTTDEFCQTHCNPASESSSLSRVAWEGWTELVL